MLESLEGKRGEVRVRPPLPADQGPVRPADGRQQRHHARHRADDPRERAPRSTRDFGMGESRGTLPLQLAGNIKRGGLVERAFGLTLRELLYDYGGGSRERPADPRRAGRRPARRLPARVAVRHAARLRGALGDRRAARPRRHRRLRRHASTWLEMARYAMEFCAIESCGKCTPCRIGSMRGAEVIGRIGRGEDRDRATCAGRGTLRYDVECVPVRPRGHDPLPRAERHEALPGRLQARGREEARCTRSTIATSARRRRSRPTRSRSKSTARPSPCPRAPRSCGPRRSPTRRSRNCAPPTR